MGRIIAVGDRNQAIYGFRGAHHGSMDELKDRFGCRELPLSISYRCPRTVVEKAKQWVPHIESHPGAADGYVGESGTDWAGQAGIALDGISKWQQLNDFLAGDVILCRVTRPLVALAFTMIRARIPCRVLGRDLGQGLVALVKRVVKRGRISLQDDLGAFAEALEGFRVTESQRLAQAGKRAELARLEDQVATIQVFIQGLEAQEADDGVARRDRDSGDLAGAEGATVAQLNDEIERMFVDNGTSRGVTLSTVHKAKGLEWDRVFVLDAGEFMPSRWASQPWELQQEQNLMYVAATRSKRELRYVSSWELTQKD